MPSSHSHLQVPARRPLSAFVSPSTFIFFHTRNFLPPGQRRIYQPRTKQPQAIIALPPAATLLTITAASTHSAIPNTLRGPPIAFLLSALLTNLTLLPTHAPIYTTLIDIAPTAICLLLLQPLHSTSTQTPPASTRNLISAFAVGAIGTTIGALLSGLACFLPGTLCWQVAAAFAATYIGGTVNYVGIVNALEIPTEVAAAGLAADLALMALYFGGLFALAARARETSEEREGLFVETESKKRVESTPKRAWLALFPVVVTVGITVASRAFAATFRLPAGTDLLLMSVGAAALSRESRLKDHLRFSGKLGDLAVTAFFGALGATTRLSAVTGASPGVVMMAGVVLLVHAVAVFVVGKCVMRLPTRDLLVASNANVGGASTAAAFAAAFGWRSLIPGAVLVGSLGYLVGTPVGLAIFGFAGRRFSRMSM